ncbi:MAG TPA: hypothetical protein PLG21_00915 [Anaerolineae bacterium]|nr:hypothetical protein [Anaerolineae bacterium]
MMGPWWGGAPMGMACRGIIPALVGFALGYVVASTRATAMFAFPEEEKRRR